MNLQLFCLSKKSFTLDFDFLQWTLIADCNWTALQPRSFNYFCFQCKGYPAKLLDWVPAASKVKSVQMD